MMLVSDASIFIKTKTAAWAAVAEVGGVRHEWSGLCVGEVGSSMEAEMRGAANGLTRMRQAGLLERGGRIMIVCDNLAVVNGISGAWRVKKPEIQPPFERIKSIIHRYSLTVVTMHIRGHTKLEGAEYDMNRICDEVCGPIARAEHERRLAAREVEHV